MKFETMSDMMRRRAAFKASGATPPPLFSLKECCAAAGVSPGQFGRWAHKYPGAPKPALITGGGTTHRPHQVHYRKQEVIQWVNQIRQQLATGETKVPDLQTELSKVINQWETPVQDTPEPASKQFFAVTNNVTRVTFNFVRDNPGLTRVAIVKKLVAQGYKETSTSTLIAQMVRQGLFKMANDGVFATQTEYTPLKSRLLRTKPVAAPAPAAPERPKTRAVRKPRAVAMEPVAVPVAVPVAAPVVAPPPQKLTVHNLLHTLPIAEARELYDELHKIFTRA